VTGGVDTRKALQQRLQGRLQGPAIFEDEAAQAPKPISQATTVEDRQQQKRDPKAYTRWGGSLVAEHISRATDPDPRSRVRWERKMVIRAVRRGTNPFSVEPRKERIARTERTLTSRSPWLPTSTKKLVHLARQIQGKTVDDALVQMRYSKKKMAQEVGVQLREAHDTAVVERGMGLNLGLDNQVDEKALAMAKAPIKIQTKDKKFIQVDNPTRMYVAEAWVNRGPLRGQRPSYRARGRVQLLDKPSTSEFSIPRTLSPLTIPESHVNQTILQASQLSSRKNGPVSASIKNAKLRSFARARGSISLTGRSRPNVRIIRGRLQHRAWERAYFQPLYPSTERARHMYLL